MAQQRPSSGKQNAKNQSRTVATKSAPTKAGKRSNTTLYTWGLVGMVLAVVVALIIVSLTSSSPATKGGNGYQAAPAALTTQLTEIPASVYNTVGVTSSVTPVNAPTQVTSQKPLTFTDASGQAKPGVFYFGAEYCPYCAAERWSMIAALSRFGSMSGLGLTSSSSTDVYPDTPSFSFVKASFSMKDIAVRAIERYSNIPLSDGSGGYTSLTTPTKADAALVTEFDVTKYFPSGSNGSIPFIDIGNQFLVSGASFSPSIFNGLTRDEIAKGLSDPTLPATQAIVATANYLTAAICKTTGGQPGNVCTSKGVVAAAKAMKI